jgi:site-specific DNA recombinase
MKNLAVALYARVSSEQQTQAQTIASQVAALRDRVTADDYVVLAECEFIDEG